MDREIKGGWEREMKGGGEVCVWGGVGVREEHRVNTLRHYKYLLHI